VTGFDSTNTMVGFTDFSRVGFENIWHLPSGRFGMNTRVFGGEYVLLRDAERERLEVCRHDR
jgi:hypothetical protein